MPVETVSLFLGFLTIGGAVALIALLCALAFRSRPVVGSTLDDVGRQAVRLGLIVAATATAGSLYYSEIAGYEPCQLCWVQRGFMYPLVVLLALALWREPLRVVALLLATIGLGVSLYHRAEQQFPDTIGGSCDVANPCSGRWVDTFGFITIPTMAAMGFMLIVALLSLSFVRRPAATRIVAAELSEEVS